MIRMYGRTTFLPGWSLADLAAIIDRAVADGDRLVELRQESVADLLKAHTAAGGDAAEDFDGWSAATLRSWVDRAVETNRALVEVPVPAMRALLSSVRAIEMSQAAASSLG